VVFRDSKDSPAVQPPTGDGAATAASDPVEVDG